MLLPSTHALQEDARGAGKHQKKFGNVYRASAFGRLSRPRCCSSSLTCALFTAAEDESRPTHLLHASMPKIKEFIASKIPLEALLATAPSASSSGNGGGGGSGGGGGDAGEDVVMSAPGAGAGANGMTVDASAATVAAAA